MAVIVDAAIRERGERVDVIDVRIENRHAGRAAAVIQRYRAPQGRLETMGNPTASPASPFLGPSAVRSDPAPDAGLFALAERAVRDIVTSVTILDPSGCDTPADEPRFSPSAFAGRDGDERPRIVRFMLQGPLTAALSCQEALAEGKERVDWIAFHIDDLITRNGVPEPRFRLCVQRRTDPAMAIFDQPYEAPVPGQPFTLRGSPVFRRWGGSWFPS